MKKNKGKNEAILRSSLKDRHCPANSQTSDSVWSNMENSVLTDLRTVQNKSMLEFESNQENT